MDKFVEYKIVGKYAGQEDNHYNTLFQFENTLGCEDHACWGSQTSDQFEIIVHMTEDVNWGNKERVKHTLNFGLIWFQKIELINSR